MSEFIVNKDLFGRYAKIQVGYAGEKHTHKIITLFESNTYCDVPIRHNSKPTLHGQLVPVVNVVHCGIDESTVVRVALADCELLQEKTVTASAAMCCMCPGAICPGIPGTPHPERLHELQNDAFDLGYQTCLHDKEGLSWSGAKDLQAYHAIGTVEEFRALKEAEQKRQEGCEYCAGGIQAVHTNRPPDFCHRCGRDLKGESHEP